MGPILSFPAEFGIEDIGPACRQPGGAARCDRNSWIVGFLNATPHISIALLYELSIFFLLLGPTEAVTALLGYRIQ